MVGTADNVLSREVSPIQSVLYREVPPYTPSLSHLTGAGSTSSPQEPPSGDRAGDGAEHDLPHEKWGKCLQVLSLNNNKLQWLPDYIGSLHSLMKLDLSKYDVWSLSCLSSHTRTHAHTHTHARTHARTHTHAHTCTHTHTHTHYKYRRTV